MGDMALLMLASAYPEHTAGETAFISVFITLFSVFIICLIRENGRQSGYDAGRAIGYTEGKAAALREILAKKNNKTQDPT